MLLVAEGEAHVYPRLAPTSEWDTVRSGWVLGVKASNVIILFKV